MKANACRSVVVGGVSIAGPVTIGAVAAFGHTWQVWIFLAVLMVLAFALQILLAPGSRISDTGDGMFADMRKSWRFLWNSPGIVVIVLYAGFWHLFAWSACMVAGPWILENEYGALWAWGLLQSLFTAGLVVGGLFASKIVAPTQVLCISGLFPLLLVIAGFGLGWPIWILGVLMALSGMMLTVSGVHWATRIQRCVPEEMVPSVFSFEYVFSEGLAPLGFLVFPLLLTLASTKSILLSIVATCLAVGIAAIIWFPKRFLARSVSSDE